MKTNPKLTQKLALLSFLALGAPLFAGCIAGQGDSDPNDDEDTGEAEQALTCSGASCNGVNPYATNCVLDQINKGTGNVNANGVKVGTVSIYYSPTCQASWAYTGLNQAHGTFSVCVLNNNTGAQQCGTGGTTTYSQVSPMLYQPIGQTTHAYDIGNPALYGFSPDFTRSN